MIQQLNISNFKSIKDLGMPCKKLNVFIGEPNSGKSNIIEALALQSQNAIGQQLNKDIFRYKIIGNLFNDFIHPIEVITDEKSTSLSYAAVGNNIVPENLFRFYLDRNIQKEETAKIDSYGRIVHVGELGSTNVRYYEYKRLASFNVNYLPHLNAPNGDNLPSLLLANSECKSWTEEFFRSKELKLKLSRSENDVWLESKFSDSQSEFDPLPYFTVSETLQRVVFYTIAIKSNKDSVLLFDEPETNTFPFYTKYIAERIALDETNQFFITTHNPYLLLSLIEKSKFENLNVCIVQMKDYQTKVNVLNEKQVGQVLDFNSDVFFNFNQILSE
jgi:hypothetical protein